MWTGLSDVYSVLWIDLRNLRRHSRSLVASSLIQPLLYLVAFGYGLGKDVDVGGISYLTFVIPGIIALTSFSTSFNGASSKLQVDKFFYKSFDELLMAPISSYSIIIGKALVGVVRGLISSIAILLVGLYLSPDLIISPVFLLVLLTSCFVSALFGVLVAFIVPSHQGMSTFNSVVILPMTFLCGTFFSLNALPDAAKALLYIIPLTHSSQLLRAIVLGDAFSWFSYGALLVFGAVFFTAGVFVLKKNSI
jgi:ABC-type multidrug transport system permease subunit